MNQGFIFTQSWNKESLSRVWSVRKIEKREHAVVEVSLAQVIVAK